MNLEFKSKIKIFKYMKMQEQIIEIQ